MNSTTNYIFLVCGHTNPLYIEHVDFFPKIEKKRKRQKKINKNCLMMIAIEIKKKQNMIIMIRDYSLMANVLPKKNYKVMETETYMDM